ncbi:MAG: LptF/LptG family permease [Planctomycetes bacterium]|nr:LptF/LptG family permease [Planctomycetota bacterium]
MIFRRHDRYYLKQYVAALAAALLFLSLLIVVYDLADRVDDLPKARDGIRAAGRTVAGVLVEYYATLLPFVWMRLLPVAALIAAGFTFTWLARANELAPVVTAGVPAVRLLAPVILTGALLATAQSVARETVVPELSRRHDDLHRLFKRRGRGDRMTDVPHLFDANGGRLSMAAYAPGRRRMEGAFVTFRRKPTASGPRDVVWWYPVLDWDEATATWRATKGGVRCVLEPDESGANAVALAEGEPAPLTMGHSLVELTVRQGAALGFSSDEIAALAEAYPDTPRFRLLLHQQRAAPVAIVVLLLLGLPFVFHLGKGRMFRSFVGTVAVVAAYQLVDGVATDVGARGAINPVVAAWGAHVIFGALGVVLMTTVET